MDLSKIFVRNMKKWRKSAGVSQEKLAERCNSAYSYIRQIECGVRYPSFALIEKIALALNVPPYQLFYDETPADGQSSETQSIETELVENVSNEIYKAFKKMRETESFPNPVSGNPDWEPKIP